MTIEELQEALMANHKMFKDFLLSMDDETFLHAPGGKWNAGQQLSHVVKSLKAIHTGMVLPKFQLKVMFGKSNRLSRTYDELVSRYQEKLAAGYENRSAYMPNEVTREDVKKLADKMMSYASRISKRLATYDEDGLDTYLLPHPLLGKMTLREMGYFTCYHVVHHMDLTKKYSGLTE